VQAPVLMARTLRFSTKRVSVDPGGSLLDSVNPVGRSRRSRPWRRSAERFVRDASKPKGDSTTMMEPSEKGPADTSLRDLLASYDSTIRDAFADVADTTTGTTRVQALFLLRRAISVHDSVVVASLCPLLEDLPGGPEVARRLAHGCEERAILLARFQEMSKGTQAHNVYPAFGADIETIISELRQSFDRHVDAETTQVSDLLQLAGESGEPEVVAARMAIEARHAPLRAHPRTSQRPRSKISRTIRRNIDRVHEWNDSHHGWSSSKPETSPPIRRPRQFTRRPPSIPELLSGYDETVEAIVTELADTALSGTKRAEVAYRLSAAITVHDSILGGTLCRLLDAVPEGRAASVLLREGCRKREVLLKEWHRLVEHASPADLFETQAVEAKRIIDQLVGSFEEHKTHETNDVSTVIEQLQQRSWKYRGTGLISIDPTPAWPSPEPGFLAAHMALWAEKVPTHPHSVLNRHPTNRLLRDLYRYADRWRDRSRARRGWPTLK
jgi:hypothetical protein